MALYEVLEDGTIVPKAGKNVGNLDCLRTKVLWTNPNPNASFEAQNITLSDGNYEYLEFILRATTGINRQYSVKIKKGNGANFLTYYSVTWSPYNYDQFRTADYISDTEYSISDNYRRSTDKSDIGISNDQNIPIEIIGYYKTPAMIYTGKEILEGDGIKIDGNKISTLSSFDSQTLLYGTAEATSGITSGSVTLGDITPYKFLVFVTGWGSFKTINTYNVRSLTNGALGLYGYASQYINVSIFGSLTDFKISLDAYSNQQLWRIWGVK